MHVRSPEWLDAARAPGALVFALLFTGDATARSLLATVIPLQALALLGDTQSVSLLYFAVGLCGLSATLCVPLLVRYLRRRWVYTLGVAMMLIAAASISTASLPGQMLGMAVRTFGAACLVICLNLYILDFISRRDFGRSESMKWMFAAGAWTVGPALGVWLSQHVHPLAPYLASAVAALVLLAFFWFLRITEPELVIPATRPPPRPIANIGRFWRQPRLRLAWSIAVGRSAWWGMFFVYGPIFVVSNGLDEVTAGLVVSAGNAVLFLAPAVGWLSRRTGVRKIIVTAFAVGGLCSAAVGLCSGRPWLGVTLLVAAALCAAALDAVGNIPFLRSVRRHERAEMTSVFSTYRDLGELLPPGVFSALLELFRLPAVFFAGGGAMLVFAALARLLPRRL